MSSSFCFTIHTHQSASSSQLTRCIKETEQFCEKNVRTLPIYTKTPRSAKCFSRPAKAKTIHSDWLHELRI